MPLLNFEAKKMNRSPDCKPDVDQPTDQVLMDPLTSEKNCRLTSDGGVYELLP